MFSDKRLTKDTAALNLGENLIFIINGVKGVSVILKTERDEVTRDYRPSSYKIDEVESAALAIDSTSIIAWPPLVAVLICTHDGARFLAEQLDSIISQDYKKISLWASDDGSKDDTKKILARYQSLDKNNRFTIHYGPREGFAANFHSLICHLDIQADYFAYSDQDDVWEPDKLSCAIAKLENVPSGVPALYCSRTILIDESGHYIGLSPLFEKPPSFANALVQNVGGGNTMVMN